MSYIQIVSFALPALLILALFGRFFWTKTRSAQLDKRVPVETDLDLCNLSQLGFDTFIAEDGVEPEQNDQTADLELKQGLRTPDKVSASHKSQRKIKKPNALLLIKCLSPKNLTFKGDEVLSVLSELGFEFCDRYFFRFQNQMQDGSKQSSFYLANISEPGTFDIHGMATMQYQGFVLFLELDKLNDPMLAFDAMIQNSQILCDKLGGVLLSQQNKHLDHPIVEELERKMHDYIRYETQVERG